jgi:flagellar biosynthesis chaperone FliJ
VSETNWQEVCTQLRAEVDQWKKEVDQWKKQVARLKAQLIKVQLQLDFWTTLRVLSGNGKNQAVVKETATQQ